MSQNDSFLGRGILVHENVVLNGDPDQSARGIRLRQRVMYQADWILVRVSRDFGPPYRYKLPKNRLSSVSAWAISQKWMLRFLTEATDTKILDHANEIVIHCNSDLVIFRHLGQNYEYKPWLDPRGVNY